MKALARKVVEAALDRAERGLERVRWLAGEAGLAQHLPRWTDAAIRVCLATGVGGGRVTESLERAADKLEQALGDEGWTALQDMRCERDALEYDLEREQTTVRDLQERLAASVASEPWQAWGEGRGLQPGEAVLPRSHPGARRVSVRRTSDGGVAVRTVDDDGVTPIGPSVYLREAALRTFLDVLRDCERGDL
jgi:hypothetical protein